MSRKRLVLACLPAIAVTALFGCSAILGIPSDEGRVDESDAAPDTMIPGADVVTPDGQPMPGDSSMADVKDASMPDTRPPPSCDLAKDFDAPVLLSTISTAGLEGSPKLSDDELTIYFDAQRDPEPYFDMYTATRATITDSFGAATPLMGGVNTTDNHEFAPNISDNGLTIFFERKDPNTTVDNFYMSTRPALNMPWATAAQISGVNLPEYQGKLDVHGNGNDLYFTKKGTGTKYHLYTASKPSGGQYVIRQLTGTVGSPLGTEEYASAISEDGLTLYFGRYSGANGEEIWKVVRSKLTDDFDAINVTLETALNTPLDDEPSWLSPDGCRLYMQRGNGVTVQDIYVAIKPK